MYLPENIASDVLERLVGPIWNAQGPANVKLENLWRVMAGIQSSVIANLVREHTGDVVAFGPFKGMKIPPQLLVGLYAPTLLGSYESELHQTIEDSIARSYETIVNIGCGIGYYTIGYALRLPSAKIIGYDTNPATCGACRMNAEINNVADRVQIHATECSADTFETLAKIKTLLFVDIEGAEDILLRPDLYPALTRMDLIVEVHDCFAPGLSSRLKDRFQSTHEVEIIENKPTPFRLNDLLGKSYVEGHFDPLLATWERREGPTPWAVMTQKHKI